MKRPMCWLCLLLMAAIWLGDRTGVMPVRSPDIQLDGDFVGHKGQAVVFGRIYQYDYSENSMGICLRDVYLRSQVEDISKELLGRVLVYMQKDPGDALPLGTWVRVEGKIDEIGAPRDPGEFDSRLYHQTKKIYYRMSGQKLTAYGGQVWHLREGSRKLRRRLADSLERAAPEQAGILSAMVIGDKSLLGQEEKDLLSVGSLSHIISISGMHLSLLGILCFHLFQRLRLGLRPAAVLAAALMIFYGILVGESVATMRALGMFGLAMAARAAGRSYDLFSALSLSVIILLLGEPVYLYYSGFLLSCGCICAVGGILPQIGQIFPLDGLDRKYLRKTGETLQMGVSIQMLTLPLILWFYYEIPLYGVLVNLLAVPTLGVVLVSGCLGAVAGLWLAPVARYLVMPACLLIRSYLSICGAVKSLPGALLIVGKPQMWQVILYYGLLAGGLWAGRRLKGAAHIRWKGLGAAVFLGCWALGVVLLCSRSHRSLEITCLDVGQGDAAVVYTPQKECFLVDGGSSSQKKVGQYKILPFLKSKGISRVDTVFVSHTDADHVNGIEEILTLIRSGRTPLKIDRLVFPRSREEDAGQERLAALAEQAGAAVEYMCAGERVTGADVQWEAISPLQEGQGSGDINENSLVLLLGAGEFQGLFTGDIGEEQEERLAGHLMDCDFLKVAHHGSRYSTGDKFLKEVCPEIAVASASATNTYGHPHPDTLGRLEKNGCRVFLTKDSGAVTLEVEDGMIRVDTYLH